MIGAAQRRGAAFFGLWGLAIGFPLLAMAVLISNQLSPESAVDWQTYVHGVDRLTAGESPYASWQLSGRYGFDMAAAGHGYVYPPSAAAIMAPFVRPFGFWILINVGMYLTGLLAVARAHRALTAPVTSLLLWSALITPGFWDAVKGGAVSMLLAGVLGLTYAGIPLAGVGAALKVFPAIWVVLTSRVRPWMAIWSLAVGIGLPVLVSLLLAGLDPWRDFVVAYLNADPACGLSLASTVCAGLPQALPWAVGAAMLLATIRLPRPLALAVLGAIPLVIAPEIWKHYLLMLVPGLVAVLLAAAQLIWSSPLGTHIATLVGTHRPQGSGSGESMAGPHPSGDVQRDLDAPRQEPPSWVIK